MKRAEGIGIEAGQRGIDVDRAEAVARPFLDREHNRVAIVVLVELPVDRDNPEVGVAVAHIEAAKLFLIGVELRLR